MVFLSNKILMSMVTRRRFWHSKELLKNVIRCGACLRHSRSTSSPRTWKIFWRWQDRHAGQLMTRTLSVFISYSREEILGIIHYFHHHLLGQLYELGDEVECNDFRAKHTCDHKQGVPEKISKTEGSCSYWEKCFLGHPILWI